MGGSVMQPNDAERRDQAKRRAKMLEAKHGGKLDKMKRDDVLALANEVGQEFARHVERKVAGRRAWRSQLSANDRRNLIGALERRGVSKV